MHNDPIIYKPLSQGWHEDDMDPSIVNSVPDLIGRIQGDEVDMESVRSETAHLVSVSVPFDGAAMGVATVRVFQSSGIGDDAGIVMRVTVDNRASAFQPHAVLIPNGVDLHIAGDTESVATLEAIQQAATQALLKLQHRTKIAAATPATPRWPQILMDMRPTSAK
ncbi:MAG: hypothetical protein H7293_07215 [Candidatus Saccharibacteria bacterium]|nr:hypothetical protein [Rhodoferax sp.]